MLEKNHLQALKKASWAVFEHYMDNHGEERIDIRCGNDSNYDKPWENWQVEIPVESSKYSLLSYDTDFTFPYGYTPRSACAHIRLYWDSIGEKDPILTVIRSLRPGDKLHFFWQFSAGNGYLKNARSTVDGVCYESRLYSESLTLIVERGSKKLAYHIQSQVGPQNSASLIRLR